MSIILFLFALEFNYSPVELTTVGIDEYKYFDIYHLTFEPELIIYDFLYIKGVADVPMERIGLKFNPLSLGSTFDIGIMFKGFSAGYRHYCQHPIITWNTEREFLQRYNTGWDKFYIRFESGNK